VEYLTEKLLYTPTESTGAQSPSEPPALPADDNAETERVPGERGADAGAEGGGEQEQQSPSLSISKQEELLVAQLRFEGLCGLWELAAEKASHDKMRVATLEGVLAALNLLHPHDQTTAAAAKRQRGFMMSANELRTHTLAAAKLGAEWAGEGEGATPLLATHRQPPPPPSSSTTPLRTVAPTRHASPPPALPTTAEDAAALRAVAALKNCGAAAAALIMLGTTRVLRHTLLHLGAMEHLLFLYATRPLRYEGLPASVWTCAAWLLSRGMLSPRIQPESGGLTIRSSMAVVARSR
jgi:hypothetical protein